MYINNEERKAKIGKVSVSVSRGNSIKLRFTYPKGKRHDMNISTNTDEGWIKALRIAQAINADIELGQFDDTLAKYSPRRSQSCSREQKHEAFFFTPHIQNYDLKSSQMYGLKFQLMSARFDTSIVDKYIGVDKATLAKAADVDVDCWKGIMYGTYFGGFPANKLKKEGKLGKSKLFTLLRYDIVKNHICKFLKIETCYNYDKKRKRVLNCKLLLSKEKVACWSNDINNPIYLSKKPGDIVELIEDSKGKYSVLSREEETVSMNRPSSNGSEGSYYTHSNTTSNDDLEGLNLPEPLSDADKVRLSKLIRERAKLLTHTIEVMKNELNDKGLEFHEGSILSLSVSLFIHISRHLD